MRIPVAGLALSTVLLAGLPATSSAASGGFTSPSGNIGCYITGQGVRCDIRDHDWPTPARPASCELDYGSGLSVNRTGRGHFVCAGDTTLQAGPPLAYGSKRSAGRFTCTSRTSGMRCINRRNGHGFALSRESHRRF